MCENGFVPAGNGNRLDASDAGLRVTGIEQLAQQSTQFVMLVESAQAIVVRLTNAQLFRRCSQFHCLHNRCQPARQVQLLKIITQAFADLAANFIGTRDQRINVLVLVQPFGSRLRAHLGDARDVVGLVTDQCEVIDNLFRPDIKLFLHTVAVHVGVGHGVDQCHLLIDELRHVLVAGRYQHLHTGFGGGAAQGADHVIRFDALDAQQRQTECGHYFE